MRTIITLLLTGFSLSTFCQTTNKNFYSKELGWSIVIPPDFNLLDSAASDSTNKKGAKIIENSNDVKVDMSQTKTLFAAKKNQSNYFAATITPFDSAKEGDFDKSNQMVKEMAYKSFSDYISSAKLDSVSSETIIDGLTFKKFQITININDNKINMVMIYKLYKGYDFGINYVYTNELDKQDIEAALYKSRFLK